MDEHSAIRETWLVAGWPGMGNVAVGACAHLLNQLRAPITLEIPGQDHYELEQIEVSHGIVQPARLPRSMIARWENPSGSPDLLIFIAEAQPQFGKFGLCGKVLELARSQGASRVVTFASLATQLHPAAEPGVYAATTSEELLRELQRLEVRTLEEGQVGGMNGVLLAAAAEHDIPAACLLGEIPFFAAGVPNPKASRSVLETFCVLAGIEVDMEPLSRHAEAVEEGLLELMEKMQEAARQASEGEETSFETEFPEMQTESESGGEREALDFATRQQIEALFEAARHDRARAVKLKEVLDRLGVFDQYEDRFLDLFRRGE